MDFTYFAQVLSTTFVLVSLGGAGWPDVSRDARDATPTHESGSAPATAARKKPDRILAKSHRVVIVVRTPSPGTLPSTEFE